MNQTEDRIRHWEHIYQTKSPGEVSWYQAKPLISLDLITQSGMPPDAKIIDIGGGDSLLADHLLELGYTDITVLDISITALEKAKQRLGEKARLVKWIESDITAFQPTEKYDIWHDRAAFHFLVADEDVKTYAGLVKQCINENGRLMMGTFSEQGPKRCSGIDIRQYSEDTLCEVFNEVFEKENGFETQHQTPFDTLQQFVFCTLKRMG